MTTLRRSLAFSFADRYGGIVLGFIGTILLSRLLTPRDFGVFTVGASVVMMIEVVRDFGVGTFLIQERLVTPMIVRSAFTVSLGLSVACAAALLALSGPIAEFYREPGLRRVIPFFAANFILIPFSTPTGNLLRRDMAFDALAFISLAGAATNLAIVTVLAILGFGYMSLAWASLVSTAVRTVAMFARRGEAWMFIPTLHEWRKVVAFGGYSTATAILNVVHDSLPQLIIGRALGFDGVGLFGRAAGICQLPDRLFVSALQPVMLPVLAEHVRNSTDLKAPYFRALTYMTALQWPMLLCLALLADPVVRVLLGAQWAEAAPLLRIMALAAAFLFPAFMTTPMLVAIGRVRDTLLLSLISIPPSLVLIFAASFVGLQAIAATQVVAGALQVYVALHFIKRHVRFTWRELAVALWRSFAVALCAAAGPSTAILLAGSRFDLSVVQTILATTGAFAGWLGGLVLTRHPLFGEMSGVVETRWRAFRRVRAPS